MPSTLNLKRGRAETRDQRSKNQLRSDVVRNTDNRPIYSSSISASAVRQSSETLLPSSPQPSASEVIWMCAKTKPKEQKNSPETSDCGIRLHTPRRRANGRQDSRSRPGQAQTRTPWRKKIMGGVARKLRTEICTNPKVCNRPWFLVPRGHGFGARGGGGSNCPWF